MFRQTRMVYLLQSVGSMASVRQLSPSVKHKHIELTVSRISNMSRNNVQNNEPRNFRTALLNWFEHNKRDDPWRINPTPYSVWIAEVMLQQTVVQAVIPHYRAWMKRFPDIQSLASSSEKEVLRQWEGLGYYSRARNLHKSARLLVTYGGANLPDSYESLIRLPGIGDYTASAILSIAFRKPYPVLDANVRRVVRRLLAMKVEDSKSTRQIREFLDCAISSKNPGAFNEAMMELGQTICRVRNPLCDECPVKNRCSARSLGIQSEIPEPKPRVSVDKTSCVLVIRCRDSLLLQKNETGLFAGMWSLPRVTRPRLPEARIISQLLPELEIQQIEFTAQLRPRVHTYTKYIDRLRPIVVRLNCSRFPKSSNGNWVAYSRLDRYPLPAIDRKIINEMLAL